jgi:hypothetical protein
METFQIPRRRVTEYFGLARSTLYRWLHKIEDQQQTSIPANKTPMEITSLIWEITKSNINWGRIRIANQLALLNIFISASTVRNILNRPIPRKAPVSPATSKKTEEKTESLSIPARYPNHVWSVETTMVLCWGLRPDDVYYEKKPEKPKRNAKTVLCNIEHHRFQKTRNTGYRLKKAA